MILYISSNENVGIFDFLSEEQGMVIKKFSGSFYLKQFVIQDMRSLSHYSHFAIDMSSLRDTEEEVLEAIMAFKSMYTSRIIFYFETVDQHWPLIDRLIEQGIYNIVITEDVELLKEKIKIATGPLGMNKKDAQGLLNQKIETNDIFRSDYKFLQKEAKIAITGVMSRVGTTTMAFDLCHFLASKGAKVCYVEANSSGHLAKILKANSIRNTVGDTKIFNGICFMGLNGNSEEEFDFVIYDMGVVEFKVVTAIKNKCDVGILCATGKPYEMEEYEKINQLFEGISISKIFSFVHELEQRQIAEQYGEGYFSEYTPSLFDSEKNSDMWMQILNRFVVRN